MDNFKKSYIIIPNIVFVLIIIGCAIYFSLSPEKVTYNTLSSVDNSFSIVLPSNVSYQINNTDNNHFILDLYSPEDEMFLYATKIPKQRELDLYQVVEDDKVSYLKEKQNIREESTIIPYTIGDYKSYEYKFIHYDSSYQKDFYSNIVWIETPKNLYILNFEVANDNKEKYLDIFNNIKNSFTEL